MENVNSTKNFLPLFLCTFVQVLLLLFPKKCYFSLNPGWQLRIQIRHKPCFVVIQLLFYTIRNNMFVIQHNLHILSLMRISCEEDENVKNIYVFA